MGCEAEGCLVFVVAQSGVSTFFEEQAGDGKVAFDGGEHEERPAVLVGEVGVEAGGEGRAEGGFVTAFDEVLGGAIGQWISVGGVVNLWYRRMTARRSWLARLLNGTCLMKPHYFFIDMKFKKDLPKSESQ